MTYTMIPHIKTVSCVFLDHILDLFETQATIIRLGLKEKAIFTLLDFMGTPAAKLVSMEWQDDENKTPYQG